MSADLFPTTRPTPSASRRFPLDLAFLAAILLLGLINLPQPFGFDQALFAIGARKMAAGAVLYRDFWDVKQPAIFVFYLLGGRLFGFSEVGIHLFELLYLLLFSAALIVTLREAFEHHWGPGLAALLAVGYPYAIVGDWHLTQVEGLAGPPIYLALWFATRAADPERKGRTSWAWSGVMGGIVLLFKLLFLPIVGSFWLVALMARTRRRSRARVAGAASDIAWLALGILLPLVPVIAYLAFHGLLGTVAWTFFRYPAEIVGGRGDLRLQVLADGIAWFFTRWGPLLAPAFLGALIPLGRGRDPLRLNLALWFVVGLAVIVAQRLSFFQYHFMLLTIPAGVLAVRGLDLLAAAAERSGLLLERGAGRAAFLGGLLMLCSWGIGEATTKATLLARHGFAWTPSQRVRYQNRVSTYGYGPIRSSVAFLSAPGARPGPVFVLGDPLVNWLSGRDQGVPRHGGILWGHATAEDWAQWTSDLRVVRPPYIFVQHGFTNAFQLWPDRCVSFLNLLAQDYTILRRDGVGVWYERRAADGPP